MAVPEFQAFMLPLLKIAGDGQEHTQSEVKDKLARHFQISVDDLKEMLPSGRQTKFDNRVAWAGVHLRKACLLESTGRGRFRITKRGSRSKW